MAGKISGMIALALIAGATGAGISYYLTGSNEPSAVYSETSNVKLTGIRKDLKVLKQELRDAGEYKCCIKGDCNWCALQMEHCPCDELVQKKGAEESCPECAAAWNNKQGKIPGVDPDAIRVTTFGVYGNEPGGHHHGNTEESSRTKESDQVEAPAAQHKAMPEHGDEGGGSHQHEH